MGTRGMFHLGRKHRAMGKMVRKENSIICGQKGWEMFGWNQKKKKDVLAEKFIVGSLFLCLSI